MAEPKLINMKTGTDSYEGEDGKVEQRDEYPWGLLLTLNSEVIKRLRLTLPKVGDEMMLVARVKVMSTGTSEDGKETRQSADMQITDMGLGPVEQQPQRSAASVMYGGDEQGGGE